MTGNPRSFRNLGSFIDHSALRNTRVFDLEKWGRLKLLHERIRREEELRRWRRREEEMQVDEILKDLWSIMPPLTSRHVLDMKVKQLLKLLRAKGLTRGREKRVTLAALLFLILSEENLKSHATHLKISFGNIEDVARIFKNNLEVSLSNRTFSEPKSSL
jgi:transcription initiation factor TFIIIB Brf1 subunit/transcription initiation factor TFIIB